MFIILLIFYCYLYIPIFYILFYRYDLSTDDNYSQAGLLYRNVLGIDEQNRLAENIVNELKNAADFLQVTIFIIFIFITYYIFNIHYFVFLFRKRLFIILLRLMVIWVKI